MRHLSDQQLVTRLENLRGREHKVTLAILCLLREVERRKLYLPLGHASLFDFAVRRLAYSESAAGRRIQAARCIARHPEVGAMLRRHEVNLSTVALVSRVLTDDNKTGLLDRIRGKSQRDVIALVGEMSPVSRIRDQVKPVSARAPDRRDHSRSGSDHGSPALFAPVATLAIIATTELAGATAPAPVATAPAAIAHSASTPDAPAHGATAHSRSGSGALAETRYKVQFGARPEVVRKLEEARALLSSRFPRGATLEDVIETALDALLEQKSPRRRDARRAERRGRERAATQPKGGRTATQPKAGRTAMRPPAAGTATQSKVAPTATQSKAVAEAPRSRHIPAVVRDAVWLRDDGRCTYVGTDGRRCGSTHLVQVDHIEPFVLDGPNESSNLRLLCGPHNRLEAVRILGSTVAAAHLPALRARASRGAA